MTNPRALDAYPDDKTKKVYGPSKVAQEARDKGAHATSVIADPTPGRQRDA